jgi:hypothetical protein
MLLPMGGCDLPPPLANPTIAGSPAASEKSCAPPRTITMEIADKHRIFFENQEDEKNDRRHIG